MTESAAETNEALRSLAACYAAGVDRRQLDLFLSAFRPGATLAVHQPQAGPDDKPLLMRGHSEIGRVVELIARYPATFHLLGQVVMRYTATGPLARCTASPTTTSRVTREPAIT